MFSTRNIFSSRRYGLAYLPSVFPCFRNQYRLGEKQQLKIDKLFEITLAAFSDQIWIERYLFFNHPLPNLLPPLTPIIIFRFSPTHYCMRVIYIFLNAFTLIIYFFCLYIMYVLFYACKKNAQYYDLKRIYIMILLPVSEQTSSSEVGNVHDFVHKQFVNKRSGCR